MLAAAAWTDGPRRSPAARCRSWPTAALALSAVRRRVRRAVWRHGGIGAGRAHDAPSSPNRLASWMHDAAASIVWDEDGVESSVALAARPNGYAFIVNGKSDGSARGDAGTQVMLGLLGAIRHPQPRARW